MEAVGIFTVISQEGKSTKFRTSPERGSKQNGIFLARLPEGTREIFHLGQALMAGSLTLLPTSGFASVDRIPDSHTCAGPGSWLYLPGAEGGGPPGVPHRQLHQAGADRVCPVRH